MFYRRNVTQKKPATQNLNKSKFEKIKDIIHDNVGKITFLTYTPLLIEEGLASIIGYRLAKPYLSDAQNKLHFKNSFRFSFLAYLRTAVFMSGAFALGIYIKDKILDLKTPKK